MRAGPNHRAEITPGKRHAMIIATVAQVHIAADLIQDGIIDQARLRTIARCGYRDYADIDHLFALDGQPNGLSP